MLEDKETESNKSRKKSSNVQEIEELNFLLKSGVVLCKLINKIAPTSNIEIDQLQVRANQWSCKHSFNFSFVKKSIIHLFPLHYRQGIWTLKRRIFQNFSKVLKTMEFMINICLYQRIWLWWHISTGISSH